MWSSKIKIFGMPLISIGFLSKGFFSIGFAGTGVIVLAQFGTGVVFIGQFGLGFLSVSQFSVGYFCLGQFAAGVCAAVGQMAVGFAMMGINGIGYYRVIKPSSILRGMEELFSKVYSDPMPFLMWTAFWVAVYLFLFSQRDKFTVRFKIADIFRPRWKHSNVDYRTKHIGHLKNENTLFEIALKDPACKAKETAVSLIKDQEKLRKIALNENLNEVHGLAIERIEDENLLLDIALKTDNHKIASDLLNKNSLRKHLKKIAIDAKCDEIRAKAILKSDADEDFLESRAQKEDDNPVLMALASKSQRQSTLIRIIKKSRDETIKDTAAGKLQRDRIPEIRDLLIDESSLSTARILASLIEDNDILKELSRNSKHPQGKVASIEHLRKPGDDFLLGILREDDDPSVCKAAIHKIEDEKTLTDIATSYFKTSVSLIAVDSIPKRHLLWEVLSKTENQHVRERAKARFDELKPRFMGFKIEMKCPFCSQPLFVNGLIKKVKCRSCLSVIDLDSYFWKTVLSSDVGTTRNLTYHDLTVEKTETNPKCAKCGSDLEVDLYPFGKDSYIQCRSCGEKNPSFPVPDEFKSLVGNAQLFCSERQNEDTEIESKVEPVSISCIKCGAPLIITPQTPRNVKCNYCETVQYLPDALWTSIHPARKKRQWFVSFNDNKTKK